jgi:UDP-N-acetylmuramate dehydrogenase
MTASAIQAVASQLEQRLGAGRATIDAPLAPLTTFKVGGAADLLVDARSEDELVAIASLARHAGLPVTPLGGGSNVLVGDGGVRGVVVLVRDRSVGREDLTGVRAGAGLNINGLVRWLVGQGLAGLEAWAGTPGTVGGALHGNAHFKGVNIGELVREVRILDPAGMLHTLPAAQMTFGYDSSRLQRSGARMIHFSVSTCERGTSFTKSRT